MAWSLTNSVNSKIIYSFYFHQNVKYESKNHKMDKEQIGCCYFVDSSGLRCFCTLRRPSLPQPCNFPPLPPATTPPATTVINLHKAAFQIRNKAAYINTYEFRTRDMPLPSLSTSCVLPPPLHTPHLTLIRHKLCLLPPNLPPTLPYTSCAS